MSRRDDRRADEAELTERERKALANENTGDQRRTRAAISARGFSALLRTSGRSDAHRPAIAHYHEREPQTQAAAARLRAANGA